ncbi:hypothetical protein ACSBR1_013410 [Camellia fascicularis]
MSCGKESGETDEIYECNFEDILDVSKKIEASKVEMTFGSKDEAHQYYASYARQEGFEVMIRSSRQADNGSIKYFTLACARTGKTGCTSLNSFKPNPTKKKLGVQFGRVQPEQPEPNPNFVRVWTKYF